MLRSPREIVHGRWKKPQINEFDRRNAISLKRASLVQDKRASKECSVGVARAFAKRYV